MRFTGQVKIPDLDYPGVPASVQLDGKQVELFVEGESLGRWSLVDVRAERLISSAFSLKLAGEEVTFIADQPTEFAYGGVEAMARVWAKHRSMRLPRRMVANSRSRQGTKPSRIPDLREAIEETLAGTSPTALGPVGIPPRTVASGIASLRQATGRRADVEPSASDERVSPAEAPPAEPEPQASPDPDHRRSAGPEPQQGTPAEVPGDPAQPESAEAPDQHDPVPESPDTPDAVLAEPEAEQLSPPPATDSVFKQSVPWATREEAETEVDQAELPAPPVVEPHDRGPVPAESSVPDEPEPARTEETAPSAAPQSGSVPWLAPPPDEPPAATDGTTAEPPPEPQSEDDGDEEPTPEPERVVDLGAFEDGDEGDRRDNDGGHPAHDDDEDAPIPVAATAARGGIIGAVRSAFVRNRVEHSHVYVEAPGGLGIKRQICADCGHISIGME